MEGKKDEDDEEMKLRMILFIIFFLLHHHLSSSNIIIIFFAKVKDRSLDRKFSLGYNLKIQNKLKILLLIFSVRCRCGHHQSSGRASGGWRWHVPSRSEKTNRRPHYCAHINDEVIKM